MSKIIDVSHHEGKIDWSKAKSEVVLAIIRTQYGLSTIDSQYKQNIEGCQRNSIPFGVYMYATFTNKEQALQQAKDFYNRAKGYNPLFYVLDIEEGFGASVSNIVEGTQAFIDYLKEQGVKVGLYTGHHIYKPYKMDTIKNYDFLWIPRYSGTRGKGEKPDYPCDLWQYTDKGIVAGINAEVDLNALNGDKDLNWFISRNNGGDEEELTFSSSTLEEVYKSRSTSSGTEKLLVEKAVEILNYDESWLKKLEKSQITEGDKAAIAYELAVHYAKRNQ